jgi:hypothetical protein
MFEEYQQPAIQTTIVPYPQSLDHGLYKVFRNPYKNRGWPAALRKKTKSTKLIVARRYSNRDPNKQEVGFIFV